MPWKSAEAVNEALADKRYFDEATLKSPADIKKHITVGTFKAPTSLQGLTRVLTNYVRLLEVIFDLVQHERVLESRITPILIINLLWKVHQDSRQFFTHCEWWDSGELLPQSFLDHTVRKLVADINISLTITCPVNAFLGSPTTSQKREARDAPRNKPPGGGHGKQAMMNSSIPTICAATVHKFNRLHPTLDISSFVQNMGLQYSDVKVGGGQSGQLYQFCLAGQMHGDMLLPPQSCHGTG